MGNAILKGPGGSKVSMPPLRDETQIFALWTIADVRELLKRFQTQVYGFAIVEAQFESIIAFKENVAQHVNLEELFEILDNDHDGRIDGLELLGGLALCCRGSFEEKAKFIYEIFDFNLNSTMSKKELVMMMMSSVYGMNLLTGGDEELEPDIDVFEAMAEDAIVRADKNADLQISYDEFLFWARSNRELMAGMEALTNIAMDAKENVQSEDSASETEPDQTSSEEDVPSLKKKRSGQGKMPPTKAANDKAEMASASSSGSAALRIGPNNGGDESFAAAPWLGQCFEPTNFKATKRINDGPATNLELSWVFGVAAKNVRNNVRYVGAPDSDVHNIVYYTAALAVVYNLKTRTQKFYMGHEDEITCLAMHPSQQIVATGDTKSRIHIWNGDSQFLTSLSIFQGIGSHGIMHLCFNPAGDRIAAVGRDPDHTVTIYDVSSGELISSAKGIPSPGTVNDISYNAHGTELVIVGTNQVIFYVGAHTTKRALESHNGRIGHEGKRQYFFSVTWFKDDAMVGTASGEIYRFRDKVCTERRQAHGNKEPVFCLFHNAQDGTLISGGRDCLIKTWDFTLNPVGLAIDMSEDLDGDGKSDTGALDSAIVSVQQFRDRILVCTKGCDVFEARLPPTPAEHHSLTRLAWGHALGELWGLAMHPLRDEMATCGDDKTLRIWSIRSHEQINLRVMPSQSRSIAYNPSGDVLCIGLVDGMVSLIEANTSALRVYSTWKHSELSITEMKFSMDGGNLVIGSADCNIYIYHSQDRKNFVRRGVCCGHTGAISHIDISANGKYIQSNGMDFSLMFWDMEGNQVKNASRVRDVAWATQTCTLAWSVQGIWPAGCNYEDINTCQAIPDLGVIITGDDSNKVNLFNFPALKVGSLHQSYVGHSSHVTNVRFSASRRFVATTGGRDRTICLWFHEVEEIESEDDDGSSSSASSGSDGEQDFNLNNEVANVGRRTIHQEAVNSGVTVAELKKHCKEICAQPDTNNTVKSALDSLLTAPVGGGDESSSSAVRPWRAVCVEPSRWTPSQGSTDVDLNLEWIHGFRSGDCRNNVLYSASGCVVYNVAALAVSYNKGTGKQQFLQGIHKDEVVGIAPHPAGQIFASGEAGTRPSIVLWNSKDMEVLSKLEGDHANGVPLLTFNTKGNLLASIGLDEDSTLCIHDWVKGILILRTPTEKTKILCVTFLANDLSMEGGVGDSTDGPLTGAAGAVGNKDIIVTGGEKVLKFWWAQGQNVQSQRAMWSGEKKEILLCVGSASRGVCVTGSVSGNLLIWKDFKAVFNVQRFYDSAASELANIDPENADKYNPRPVGAYPHKSPIQAMWTIKGSIDVIGDLEDCNEGYDNSCRYITGDKNGIIVIWRMVQYFEKDAANLRLIMVKVIDLQTNLKMTRENSFEANKAEVDDPSVRSVCERDGILLIGTAANQILEVPEQNIPFVIPLRRIGMSMTTRRPSQSLKTPTSASGGAGAAAAAGALSPTPITGAASNVAAALQADSKAAAAANIPALSLKGNLSMGSLGSLGGGNAPISQEAQKFKAPASRVSVGHAIGEVWGLAMHPTLPLFLTAGDDCSVKCWSLTNHKLLSHIALGDKCRAVDIQPDAANEFAIALNNGQVWVLKTSWLLNPHNKGGCVVDPQLDGTLIRTEFPKSVSTVSETDRAAGNTNPFSSASASAEDAAAAGNGASSSSSANANGSDAPVPKSLLDAANRVPVVLEKGPTRWCQVLKYCFDGKKLAVGSYDKNIYLYAIDPSNNEYSRTAVIPHQSYVTHLDWGVNLINSSVVQEIKPNETAAGGGGEGERGGNPSAAASLGLLITARDTENIIMKETVTSQSFDVNSFEIITRTLVAAAHYRRDEAGALVLQGGMADIEIDTLPEQRRAVTDSDIRIQSTSGAYDLTFTDGTGKRVESASSCKDAWWASFTCPLGWPVGGVWPADDGISDNLQICAVARSHSWQQVPVLATTDNFGRVRIYNYPCVSTGASDKCYKGHAHNVTNIFFSNDDQYCVTVGGVDRAVFIWATDIEDEKRERAAYGMNKEQDLVENYVSNLPGTSALSEEASTALTAAATAADEAELGVFKTQPFEGDQGGAMKPWLGSVREPTDWQEYPELGTKPDASLELKFVYGYRGWDARSNLNFADSRFEVVYHMGAVGIVFNTQEQKQIHNTEHDDDIICLDVHPEGHTVATGEIGKTPKIVIWDANTGLTIRVIKFHRRGVSQVAFSKDGELLVSIGMDDDRTVAVHNVTTGNLLGRGKTGRGVDIYALSVGANGTIVTGGKNLVKFWSLPLPNSPGGELSSKTGMYNIKAVTARTAVSAAFLGGDAVTGMSEGSLLLWKERTNTKYVKNAHKGPVTAMFSISENTAAIDSRENGPRIISGGKDGYVHVWDIQLNKVWSLDLNLTTPASALPQIQAVATKENRLLIGTKAAEIYEISMLSNNTEVHKLVQGHFSTSAELWGLAVHPTMPIFATCCDDMTLRLWNSRFLQPIAGGIAHLGAKVRAVAFNSDGTQIAAATYDGKIHVLDSDLKQEVALVTVGTAWIQCLKYSPDGKYLACGAHDNIISLLETKAYSCSKKLKGHHSYITAIDFSKCGGYLQSASGDYELLFWDCSSGKQITSATQMRDTPWATFTSTLGWPVQGIWPPEADGTDVNTVDRSPNSRYLCTGDDFGLVKLFRYPCPKEKSKFLSYKGHSAHVTNVKFSFDGRSLISVGGLDKTIMQFDVVNTTGQVQKKLKK